MDDSVLMRVSDPECPTLPEVPHYLLAQYTGALLAGCLVFLLYWDALVWFEHQQGVFRSDWEPLSGSDTLLSLVGVMVVLSYAMKTQLKAPKAPSASFGTKFPLPGAFLASRCVFMARGRSMI